MDGIERHTETAKTVIGTMEVETPKRVKNQTTDKYQDLTNLSETGYCRQFLALYSHMDSVHTINVDESPVLSFDKDRFDLRETDGQFVLVKQEPASEFGEMVLDEDRSLNTDNEQ